MRHSTLTKRISTLALIVCMVAPAWGCKKAPPERRDAEPLSRQTAQFDALGTQVRTMVLAIDAEAAMPMFDAARKQIDGVGSSMSTFAKDSEVSLLNATGAAELTPNTLAVIARARVFWKSSGGAFDITYAPLRGLWRKAARAGRIPSDEEVAGARARVGMDKLLVEGKQARFIAANMQIDLGGIAKGFAIDLATHALQDAGATAGIVDIGGDIRLFGTPPDKPMWQVQVRPVEGAPKEPIILTLKECAVATSGDYERGFQVGEQWFSHIIDPTTGRPVANATSVTVVAPDATTADALATAMSVLTPEKSVALADSTPGVECLLMHRDESGKGKLTMSKGFSLLILNPDRE